MLTVNSKVKVKPISIDLNNSTIIERIQFYNIGKVGVISKIEDGIATIESNIVFHHGKRYADTTVIRIEQLDEIE